MAKSESVHDAAFLQNEYLQAKVMTEEYLDKIYIATYLLQDNRCEMKSRIRDTFARLYSLLHKREMLLYQQVDAVINCQTASLPNITPNTAVDKTFPLSSSSSRRDTYRWTLDPLSPFRGKLQVKSSEAPLEIPSKKDWKSKFPKPLKFVANFAEMKEAIRTFGYLDIDYESMKDQNFTYIETVFETDTKVDHQSSDANDQDQNEEEVASVTSSSSSESFEILPDHKAANPYDAKKDNNEDADFTFVGSFSGDPGASEMTDDGLPTDTCPEALVVDGISRQEWLKKPDSCVRTFSNADAVTQDREVVFSSSGGLKTKESETSSLAHISDLSSDVSDLSSDLEDMSFCDESKNISAANSAVASNVNHELQHSRISSSKKYSGTSPDFTSIINKMLGKGNNGWVERKKFSAMSDHCDRSMTTDVKQMCSDPWLAGRISLKAMEVGADSETSLAHVYGTEESRPVHSIRKMFSPYFRSHDKNIWLVKSCTLRKKSRHS